MQKWILSSIKTVVHYYCLLLLHVLARTWSCWHSLWVFGDPYINADALCNYLCQENSNPFTLTWYNSYRHGWGPAAKQSKQKCQWDCKLHCKHFLGKLFTSYKKVCVVLNFCPWCKNHFPLVLLWYKWKMHFV